MGGFGSGGHNRLSDAEKKRRGTFVAKQSDAIYDARAAANVLAFPTLREIPAAELPLNEIGSRKYDELARALFDAGRLTTVSRMLAEQVASLFQEQHRRMSAGLPVPGSLSDKMQRALAQLKLADGAPTIAQPQSRNERARRIGFAARLAPPG